MSTFKENRFQKFMRVRFGEWQLRRPSLSNAVFVVHVATIVGIAWSPGGNSFVKHLLLATLWFSMTAQLYGERRAKRKFGHDWVEMMIDNVRRREQFIYPDSPYAYGHDVITGEVISRKEEDHAS